MSNVPSYFTQRSFDISERLVYLQHANYTRTLHESNRKVDSAFHLLITNSLSSTSDSVLQQVRVAYSWL